MCICKSVIIYIDLIHGNIIEATKLYNVRYHNSFNAGYYSSPEIASSFQHLFSASAINPSVYKSICFKILLDLVV